ncbi:Fic family protein [Pararhodospirillum photometricum]|nr:Fic family protein [Pararhodospirillum photometricum]
MADGFQDRFSGPVTAFQDRALPERAVLTGYAALIDAFQLAVPLPRTLAAIGSQHKLYDREGWRLFTPRHARPASLEGHLTFALKYEGVDLLVLKALFKAVGPGPIMALVKATPTGSYARRLWFLYEWLIGTPLDLPNATAGAYVEVLDPRQQWGAAALLSSRHRVKNNLPGTPAFCPLVFTTDKLRAFQALDLADQARATLASVPKDLLARTAAFLLLKDSRSSFAIEREYPAHDRVQRWGKAIGEAGRRALDLDELLRLQRIVIGDARFVRLGLRKEGGFVGEHERNTGAPLPDHISAKPEDLLSLMEGITRFSRTAGRTLDPVIAAAGLAFGFVYTHPFEDGNGRLHRYLIHHALSERGFNPPDMVFPVSAAILDQLHAYRLTLESYSARLLPHIQWEPTPTGNVHVLNDTADFYRYFDATPHAEFLYECVQRTIEVDLPAETAYLKNYDAFRDGVAALVDMPERTLERLLRFLRQNNGVLSKRARDNEFRALTPEEVQKIEDLYQSVF